MKLSFKKAFKRQGHKRLKLRTIVSGAFIILLIPVALFSLFRPNNPSAAWMNDAWIYRTSLTFTHNAAVSDTKVKFDIDTATLITAGKMQSDCGDSRFTDVNGKVLEYYIDAGVGACNTSSTDYYVLIPSIVNGSNVIYHYYGNPTVVNGTNAAQFTQSTTTPSGGAATTGTEAKTTGPVIYYKMDEAGNDRCSGLSNDVCDARGTNIDGAISNGTAWINEDLCLSGKCLYFDGSDDVVTTTQTSAINLSAQLAAGFTFETWIKPFTAGEGTGGQIFFKGTNTWLRVDTLSSGVLDIEGRVDLATTDATLNVASKVKVGRWTHVALSYTDDADDEITIWVNGVAVGTSTNGVGSPATDTNNLLIGGTTTNNFKGLIDEFKIYNYERSTAQMATDSFANGTAEGNAALFGQRSNATIGDGLIGYWPMNESAANGCTGGANDTCDYSGMAFDLAWTNNTTTTIGKYAAGTIYDGTDDYAACTDANCGGVGNLDFGVSPAMSWGAWMKTSTSGTQIIAGKKQSTATNQAGYFVYQNSTSKGACKYSDGTVDIASTGTTSTNDGKWHFIFCTSDGRNMWTYVDGALESTDDVSTVTATLNNAEDFRIGTTGNGNNDFNGSIDEVRVYNRMLTTFEVRQLYTWAPAPVGYWPFDENGGQVAYDLSGNDWWADLGSSSAAEGEDPTYVTGKYGTGLNFSGGDNGFSQVVNVGDDNYVDFGAKTGFTISAWVKVEGESTFNNSGYILDKINTGSDAGFTLYYGGSGGCDGGTEYNICLTVQDGTDSYTIATDTIVTLGSWYYITATFDRASESNSNIYFNGIQQPVTRDVSGGTFSSIGDMSTSSNLCIGATSSGVVCGGLDPMNGPVDDVKIYNYPRTQSQILKDMAGGHALGGLPTGSQVGHWNLDDMNGTTAQDGTANNQDLTTTNSPAWTTSGKINAGIDFESSSSQYASAADSDALSVLGDLSVSAWINPESVTAATLFPIAGKGGGAVTSYLLAQYGDEIRMYIGSSSNYVTTNATNLTTSTWYHVTGTYNAANQIVKIYVNGQEQAATTTGTIPTSITDGADSFMVGGFLNTTAASFQVSATADDGLEQANTTWSASPTNGADGFGYYSGVGDVESGFRFNNVNIAQGTTITGAHLEVLGFTGNSVGTPSSVHGKVYADDVDNAAAWSSSSRPSQITTTTAAVDWDPTTWSDSWISSPDITTVIQEIVSRGSWASGNSLRIAVWNDGVASGQNVAAFHDYDNGTTAATKLIVNYTSGSSSYYDGKIDDVQVFSAQLTADQVGLLMNGNSAINFGTTATSESTQITGTAETPPVGYWKFNENSGQTTYDSSGNSNNGILGTTTSVQTTDPTWNNGKFGAALHYDGTNSSVDVADSSVLDVTDGSSFTISVWVRKTGNSNFTNPMAITSKRNSGASGAGYELMMAAAESGGCNYASSNVDGVCLLVSDGTDVYTVQTGATITSDSTWHHIEAVYDDATAANNNIYIDGKLQTVTRTGTLANINSLANSVDLCIGKKASTTNCDTGTTNSVNGEIDELKIFNYARTQAQAAYDYNRGGPIGWWKFDDCTGTTAYDASGNGNNATLTYGGGTYTQAGACTSGTASDGWYGGAVGKFNGGIALDTTTDTISVGNITAYSFERTDSFSTSIWFKTTTDGNQTLLSKQDSTAPNKGWNVQTGSGGFIYFQLVNSYSSNTLEVLTPNVSYSDGNWHHVVTTYDGSSSPSGVHIYFDGKDKTLTTNVNTLSATITNSISMYIGSRNGTDQKFGGLLDSAQLFNYALTQSQVNKVYNGGSSARFGPLTGTPAP